MQRYKDAIKDFLSQQLYTWRTAMSMTQEESAELLFISTRAYGDLERGKYCFSTSVLLLFLSHLHEEELLTIMREMRENIFHMAGVV